MLKSLFFILHNRRAVGKIVRNKTCDVTVGERKKCRKFKTVLFFKRGSVTYSMDQENSVSRMVIESKTCHFEIVVK